MQNQICVNWKKDNTITTTLFTKLTKLTKSTQVGLARK